MTAPTPAIKPKTLPRPVLGAVVIGFIGSALILLGSFSVGWLPSVSPLNRVEPIIFWRTTEPGVFTGTTLLVLGCWLLFWGWVRLGIILKDAKTSGKHTRFIPGGLKTVNATVALWAAPQLLAIPVFSRDMFAYVNQGRLVLTGQDPYVAGISAVSNWFQVGSDELWAQDGTPYGPLYLWISAAVTLLAGEDNIDMALFLFRLCSVLGLALTMFFLPRLAEKFGVDAARAQWIACANPLVLISFIIAGHNDSLMIGLFLAGIYAVLSGRGVAGVLWVTAAIGIKPIAVVLLPFIGLWWAGPEASWGRRIWYWVKTLGIFLIVMTAIGSLNGYWFGWVEVMAGTGNIWSYWSPIYMAVEIVQGLLSLVGLDAGWVPLSFKTIARIISVLIVLWFIFRGGYENILLRMTLALAALVLFSPVIHPWYLLWLAPLVVLTKPPSGWPLKVWVLISAFFITYGAGDQLFVWQFLHVHSSLTTLTWVLSVLAVAWILLLDKFTSPILREGWRLRRAQPVPKEKQSGNSSLYS